MVKHTHQDFLISPEENLSGATSLWDSNPCHGRDARLSGNASETIRAIKLSYLDTHIDSEADWFHFIKSLGDIRQLTVLDDRRITNPIMQAYDCYTKANYIRRFNRDGIEIAIANPKLRNQRDAKEGDCEDGHT